MPASDPLSTTFAALADPTRRAILARLAQGDATVGELAKPFAMTLPGVSKHLKVLQHAGLVVQGRDAQWRPCRIDPTGLREVSTWVERYRVLWEGRLDRMEALLRELDTREPTG
jgi:DNA-binding transcriptional ArsR family regulator